jgi:hypothetical protein
MLPRLLPIPVAALCLGLCLAGGVPAQPTPLPPGPGPTAQPDGVEVLARGPVHEAYAEPSEARPVGGPLVAKEPPPLIEEAPPAEKPQGDHVVWIPGYWAWDDERTDYLWVSGFWRAAPPERTWIPGTWQKADGGWLWAAGYWGAPERTEVEYLPPPPTTLDRGPSTPAPGDGYNWAPGVWVYRTTRYVWRPGFWVAYRPAWVWIPAHYVWTPCGYVFVEGYWDFPLQDRGLLFAPVYVAPRLRVARFAYRPAYVVQTDFLIGALFVQPATARFYFGDFFHTRYRKGGYVAWVDYRVNGVTYDATFAYYRNTFARYDGWDRGLRGLYAARYSGTVPRPPRTLAAQTTVINNITINRTSGAAVNRNINITNIQNVSALAPVARAHDSRVTGMASLARVTPAQAKSLPFNRPVRIEQLSPQRLAQERRAVTEHRSAAVKRQEIQTRLRTAPKTAPRKAKLAPPRPAVRPGAAPAGKPPPRPAHPKFEERPHRRP